MEGPSESVLEEREDGVEMVLELPETLIFRRYPGEEENREQCQIPSIERD